MVPGRNLLQCRRSGAFGAGHGRRWVVGDDRSAPACVRIASNPLTVCLRQDGVAYGISKRILQQPID